MFCPLLFYNFNMTLQQLKYIIGVSEIGSLNKAAEVLYVSQPSLTASIKDVENEFNVKLFNRSSRGISLTNEGKEFVQHARQIYAQYESLLDDFDPSKKRKKKFAVSCQHYSFCVKSFINLMKKLEVEDSSNKYEFAINETRTLTVIEDVSNLRSEIGILNLSDFNRTFLSKVFKSNELGITTRNFWRVVNLKVFSKPSCGNLIFLGSSLKSGWTNSARGRKRKSCSPKACVSRRICISGMNRSTTLTSFPACR